MILIVAILKPAAAQITAEDFQELKKVFLLHQDDYTHYQNLQTLLRTQYELLSSGLRNEIRQLLTQSTFSKIRNYPPNEPGLRIAIKGTITGKDGKPMKGAKIIVFQTDASGSYAPQDSKTKKMSESDARLFCMTRTDYNGQYELNAVRRVTIRSNMKDDLFRSISTSMCQQKEPHNLNYNLPLKTIPQ